MTQAYMAVLAAFFGSLGFALLYNMRGKRILVPAVGGAFFWGFYLVFVQVTGNPYLGFFISAVLLTASVVAGAGVVGAIAQADPFGECVASAEVAM